MDLEFASIDDIVAELQQRETFNFVLLAWEDAPLNPNGAFACSPHLSGQQIIDTLETGLDYACFLTDNLNDG